MEENNFKVSSISKDSNSTSKTPTNVKNGSYKVREVKNGKKGCGCGRNKNKE
jgi:hypothetical protein